MRERNADQFLVNDPAGVGAPLYFMKVPGPKVGTYRLQLDLLTDWSMSDEVDRLVKLGARLIEVRQDPEPLGKAGGRPARGLAPPQDCGHDLGHLQRFRGAG